VTVYCHQCGAPNPEDRERCQQCNAVLDVKPASGPGKKKFKGTMMMPGMGSGAPPPPAQSPEETGDPAPSASPPPTVSRGGTPGDEAKVEGPGAAGGAPGSRGKFKGTMMMPGMGLPGGEGSGGTPPAEGSSPGTSRERGLPFQETMMGPMKPPEDDAGGFGRSAPPPAVSGDAPTEEELPQMGTGGAGAGPTAPGAGSSPWSSAGPARGAGGVWGQAPGGGPPTGGGPARPQGAPPAWGAPPSPGMGGQAPPAGGPPAGRGWGAPPNAGGPGGFGAGQASGSGGGGFGGGGSPAAASPGGFGAGPSSFGGPGGAPPAGGGAPGAPPAGPGVAAGAPATKKGSSNRTWLFLGLGCLGLVLIACPLGMYIGYRWVQQEAESALGQTQTAMGRVQIAGALTAVEASCAEDPSGASAAPVFHPQAFPALQGRVCQLDEPLLLGVTDPAQSEAEILGETDDAGRATALGLDPGQCVRVTRGQATVTGCQTDAGFQLIGLSGPKGSDG